jgi:hypothetical protein
MSAHSSANRFTALTRPRTLIAAGTAALLVVAGVVVGLASTASAASPGFDPQDPIKPVASYTFDTPSGSTVTDSSGAGNDASLKGTPAYVSGVSGTAIAVSGGANYVKLPLVAGQTDASSSFSYEFWILEQSRTSYGPIVSNQDFNACNDKGMTLYNQASPGVLEACWGQTAGGTKEYVHGINSSITGAWHHVAVVVDRTANTGTYYVDGVKKATADAGSITAATALQSGLAFNIGGLSGSEADSGDGYVNAAIDDFNFFDAAIPASQVAADFALSQPSSAPYTIAFNGNGAAGGASASESVASGQSVALTSNGFSRPGYLFTGWALSASGPVAYADGQTVSALTSTAGATVTLYAVWNRLRASGDTVAPTVSYDFDTDSGSNVADASGNGDPGVWSGTPSYTPGISGQAAYVNSPAGSNKGVNFFSLPLIGGKTDASSSFSYVFWVNESSSSSDSPIVSNQNFTHCYDQGSTLYNTAGQPGILRSCFGQNGTSTGQNYLPNVSTTSVIGTWHQVALVADRSSGTMTSYLDGQQTAQSNALSSGFTLASGFPFRVGADGSGLDTVDGSVNAAIDDFDFYAQPISAAQVENDYEATKPVTPPSNSGSSIDKGFVSDTFRAPAVRASGVVAQPVSGLWNGDAVTQYSKVSGDDWLSVGSDGTVTGTAPAQALADPATITVQATDGTTTSQITVEVPVIGAQDAPQLATATWNLWDAGSHVSDSTLKDLAVIAANGLDVIGVQQDGGTIASDIAHALGWYSVEGDGGVGIVSAYPLDAQSAPVTADALPAVGATTHMLGRDLRVWSVGLDSGSYGPEAACNAGVTDPAALVAAEKTTTRFTQATAVASAITADVATADTTPVIMLGDLESPSSADWTAATSSNHCGIGVVDWPVPDTLSAAGLTDSFRVANTDPAAVGGNTWSPIVSTNEATGTAEPQDRIDYVDFAGSPLTVLGSNTLVAGFPSAKDVQGNSWTSDHRAVVTTFSFAQVPPPTATVTTSTLVYQAGSSPSAGDLLAKAGAASTTTGATLQIDSSAVDFGTVGSYAASVTATDPVSGLQSAPVAVTVNIVPVVTISLGNANAALTLSPGQTLAATDVEAALQPSLNVPGTIAVDVSRIDDTVSGSYSVTVTGTDAYGFTASVDATVTLTVSEGSTGTPTPPPGGSNGSTSTPAPPAGGSGASTAAPTASAAASSSNENGSGLASTGLGIWLPLSAIALLLVLGVAALGTRRVLLRRR